MLIFTGTGRSGTGLYAKLFDGHHEYNKSNYETILTKHIHSLHNLPSDPLIDPNLRITIMEEFLAGVDYSTFCDSSNLYVHYLDALYAIDNNIRIVLGVRDGRDFATSGIARDYHNPEIYSGFGIEPTQDDAYYSRWQSMIPIEKMAWLWTYRNQIALDRLKHIPRENWMIVRMEDLIGDQSEGYVQSLERFTGRKANRDALSVKHNANPANNIPIKELWPPEIHEKFMNIASGMMKFFNYESHTPDTPNENQKNGHEAQWFRIDQLQSRHFENLMYYLQTRNHELVELIKKPSTPELLEFEKVGNVIRCRNRNEPIQWITGEHNTEQSILDYREHLKTTLPHNGLTVLVGGTIGYGVAELIPILLNHSHSYAVVIEPSKERVLASMHFVDLQNVIATERFYFAVSNIEADSIVDELKKLQFLNLQSLHISIAPEFCDTIEAESIQKSYKQQSIAFQHERETCLKNLQNLSIPSSHIQNVLLIDCWKNAPGSVHLQTINHFLKQRGIQTKHITLNRYRFDSAYEYKRQIEPTILEIFKTFKPGLILSYGYHAPYFVSQELFESFDAHWVQVVTNVAYFDEKQYPGEHTVLLDEHLIPFFKKRGYENLHFIPLMADYSAKQPTKTNGAFPIVFVGNSLGLPHASVQDCISQWRGRDHLRTYLQDAVSTLGDFDRQNNLYQYIHENPIPQTDSVRDEYEVFRFLLCQGSAARRKSILEKLAPLGLVLYGGDWDGYLPKDSILRNCLRGHLLLNEEIRMFERGSVFVNIHSVGHVTGPNMRFFNVAGMGGFQISDGALFERYLSPDQETVYAHSVDEYVEKTQYYLAHPEEMDVIRQQAWETVKSQWTYDHWLDELSSKLGITITG